MEDIPILEFSSEDLRGCADEDYLFIGDGGLHEEDEVDSEMLTIEDYNEEYDKLCSAFQDNLSRFRESLELNHLEEDSRTDIIPSLVESYDDIKRSLALALEKETHLSESIFLTDSNISELNEKSRKYELRLSESQSSISEMSKDVLEAEEEAQKWRMRSGESRDKILDELQYFSSLLGMSLSWSEDNQSYVLIFCGLNSLDSGKKFTCKLSICKTEESLDRKYRVLECHPIIKEKDSLEKMLNDTGELNGFVATLRRIFRTICDSSKSGL